MVTKYLLVNRSDNISKIKEKNIFLFYLFPLLSQIYVWDLRQNKTIAKYYDYKNKCSVKLSKCGNYLFSGK